MMPQLASQKEEDSQWMVNRAKQCIDDGNEFAAKSWLLTAKTLFSDSFSIQYEAFQLEQSAGHARESGKIFFEMMRMFPKNRVLWEELKKIIQSQDTKPTESDVKFLKDMFDSLPNSHQKELLTKYAESQSNLIERCRISMIVLKRFHGAAREQGIRLIKTLMDAEKEEQFETPLNIYRKTIVIDVLPLLLKNTDVHSSHGSHKQKASALFIPESHLIEWFGLTAEFCICYAVHAAGLSLPGTDNPKCQSVLKELSSSFTQSPWQLLHDQLILVASKLSWSHISKVKDKIDPSKNRSLKSKLKALSNVKESKTSLGVFYGVLSLYFYCVIEYCSFICGGNRPASQKDSVQSLMLIENINSLNSKASTHQPSKPPKKKKKIDNNQANAGNDTEEITISIAPSLACTTSVQIDDCLQVAVDCLNLLTTNPMLQPEFSRVFNDWKLILWHWTDTFNVDSFLFEGKHDACLETIRGKERDDVEIPYQVLVKENLQQASCLYCLGDLQLASELAVAAVKILRQETKASDSMPVDTITVDNYKKASGRHLVVLPCQLPEVLEYAVNIISSVIKTKLNDANDNGDILIGHLIVLSQLNWSKNKSFFHQLVDRIVANGSFSYPSFFKYITNIDILEEIAFLKNLGEINLHLFPTQSGSVGRRTITRGVNKGAKEDFASALDKQVGLEDTPPHVTVGQFLIDECDSVINC